jgi:hypothetical protein
MLEDVFTLVSGTIHSIWAPEPSIKGTVIDSDNREPVKWALIKVYRKMCRVAEPIEWFATDSLVTPDVTMLLPGDYPIMAVSGALPHQGGERDVIKIDLKRNGPDSVASEGWICVRQGDRFIATIFDRTVSKGITDETGRFEFKNMEFGLYALRIVGPGLEHVDGFLDWVIPWFSNPNEFRTIMLLGGGMIPIRLDLYILNRQVWNVTERSIVDLLPAFQAFTYNKNNAKYPYELVGAGVNNPIGTANDCCTFVEGLLIRAWQLKYGTLFSWTLAKHNLMMVIPEDPPDYFSPVTTLVNQGIAHQLGSDEFPKDWTVVQGWVSISPLTGGHTFIVLRAHPGSGRVLILESNTAASGLNGPGFRGLGRLDSMTDCCPGNEWWNNPNAPTWAAIKEKFPNRRMAYLNVKGRTWLD